MKIRRSYVDCSVCFVKLWRALRDINIRRRPSPSPRGEGRSSLERRRKVRVIAVRAAVKVMGTGELIWK